ncbi:MAG TPA: D-glycero-beta-D-manno-heptose-7-phosphate kinase [Pyrinomonadaceae bacterium]|jgi:D-beta-D-heptose 7-phosphate kinase/D-beta-D-heptose 1-phosphate adenosyltransferase
MVRLDQSRADEILGRVRACSVVVLGDLMLDEFVWGDVTRISPEAPVPVVDVRRESVHLGGAANVLANLVALGARAGVVGVVGDDRAGERLRAEMRASCPFQPDELIVVDSSRPSTLKTRIIAHNQTVVRADRERRTPVDARTEDRMIAVLQRALKEADAFVVSDYDKGAVTPRILGEVLPLAYGRGIPVLVDPKIRNFASYRPATLITPNHHEALRLTSTEEDTDEGLKRAAQLIHERLGCDCVLITRGERGMMLMEGRREPVYVETAAREVYDVTGAGDTVIATLAAALAAGASMVEAAVLANYAAGIVVAKVGTATASADELIASIRLQEPVKH